MNTGAGNKVVLSGYDVKPEVEVVGDVITVSAGDPCVPDSGDPPPDSSAIKQFLGLSVPLVFGHFAGPGSALVSTLAFVTFSAGFAQAQTAECELVPIEVEIFVDSTGDGDPSDLIAMEMQTGQYNPCPPESTYWENSPEVFGGYKGCVGERSLYPCPNDSSSLRDIYNSTPIIWNGQECVETGYTMENRTFVIAGGNPYDTQELVKRTGVSS